MFSELMINKAGNKSLMIFLTEEASLFEQSRILRGLYSAHDNLGIYLEKQVESAKEEGYIIFIRWDSIVAVTNDIHHND